MDKWRDYCHLALSTTTCFTEFLSLILSVWIQFGKICRETWKKACSRNSIKNLWFDQKYIWTNKFIMLNIIISSKLIYFAKQSRVILFSCLCPILMIDQIQLTGVCTKLSQIFVVLKNINLIIEREMTFRLEMTND